MSATTEERVNAALKTAALKMGLVDLDWLRLVDTSKVTLGAYGVSGADQLMVKLKADKPHLFGKHCRDMSETERAEKLAELRRGSEPAPMPTSERKAKDMSPRERAAFIAEVKKRYD